MGLRINVLASARLKVLPIMTIQARGRHESQPYECGLFSMHGCIAERNQRAPSERFTSK
jgi:hypothetical protein